MSARTEVAQAISKTAEKQAKRQRTVYTGVVTSTDPLRIDLSHTPGVLQGDDFETSQWVLFYDESIGIVKGDNAIVVNQGGRWILVDVVSPSSTTLPLSGGVVGYLVPEGQTYTVPEGTYGLLRESGIEIDGELELEGEMIEVDFEPTLPEFYVDAYGAHHNGIDADDAAAQEARDAAIEAGGGTVIFGTGTYRLTDLSTLHIDEAPVSIRGAGRNVTTLLFDVPTDVQDYCIRHVVTPDVFDSRTIRDLTLQGPGVYGRATGVAPNLLVGILWSTRLVLENVWIKRMRFGFQAWGDHTLAYNVKASDCYSGVLFPGSMPTLGNHAFYFCDLTENSYSSIYFTEFGDCSDSTFHHTHLGFSPYALAAEGSGTDYIEFLSQTTFENCDFESCGNEAIHAPLRAISDVALRDFVSVKNALYTLSGGDSDAWINVGRITGLEIDSPQAFTSALAEAVVMTADALEGVNWRRADDFVRVRLASLGKPTFKAGAIGRRSWLEWDGGRASVRALSSGTITASLTGGCPLVGSNKTTAAHVLTDPNETSYAMPLPTANYNHPIGAGMESVGANEALLVQEEGVVNLIAEGAVTDGDLLIIGTGSGKVRTVTGTNPQILGVALATVADGAALPTRLLT